MTLPTEVLSVSLPTNGTTSLFSFSPVVIYGPNDLEVIHVTSAGVRTTLTHGDRPDQYSINIKKYPATGSITYPSTWPTSGTRLATGTIFIKRVLRVEQQFDARNVRGYFLETRETALDRLVAIDQQQHESIGRTIKLAPGSGVSNFTFPSAPNTADPARHIQWNAAGTKLQNAQFNNYGRSYRAPSTKIFNPGDAIYACGADVVAIELRMVGGGGAGYEGVDTPSGGGGAGGLHTFIGPDPATGLVPFAGKNVPIAVGYGGNDGNGGLPTSYTTTNGVRLTLGDFTVGGLAITTLRDDTGAIKSVVVGGGSVDFFNHSTAISDWAVYVSGPPDGAGGYAFDATYYKRFRPVGTDPDLPGVSMHRVSAAAIATTEINGVTIRRHWDIAFGRPVVRVVTQFINNSRVERAVVCSDSFDPDQGVPGGFGFATDNNVTTIAGVTAATSVKNNYATVIGTGDEANATVKGILYDDVSGFGSAAPTTGFMDGGIDFPSIDSVLNFMGFPSDPNGATGDIGYATAGGVIIPAGGSSFMSHVHSFDLTLGMATDTFSEAISANSYAIVSSTYGTVPASVQGQHGGDTIFMPPNDVGYFARGGQSSVAGGGAGAGGRGTFGDNILDVTGGEGEQYFAYAATGFVVPGAGGDSMLGVGGPPGKAGTGYGAGAGGGSGADGQPGVLIVTEHYR